MSSSGAISPASSPHCTRPFEDLAQHLRLPDLHRLCADPPCRTGPLEGPATRRSRRPASIRPRRPHLDIIFFDWAFLRFCIHRERDTVSEVESLVRGVTLAASAWPAMRYWLVCTLGSGGQPGRSARIRWNLGERVPRHTRRSHSPDVAGRHCGSVQSCRLCQRSAPALSVSLAFCGPPRAVRKWQWLLRLRLPHARSARHAARRMGHAQTNTSRPHSGRPKR